MFRTSVNVCDKFSCCCTLPAPVIFNRILHRDFRPKPNKRLLYPAGIPCGKAWCGRETFSCRRCCLTKDKQTCNIILHLQLVLMAVTIVLYYSFECPWSFLCMHLPHLMWFGLHLRVSGKHVDYWFPLRGFRNTLQMLWQDTSCPQTWIALGLET